MKRFLLVLNKPNREMVSMEAIKNEIVRRDRNAVVRIQEFNNSFIDDILKFKPTTIVTFPMTCVGLSYVYYIFKLFFKCDVICFRAEGILDVNTEEIVELQIGHDKYGPALVDCEIFWGERQAKVIGNALLSRGKLSSADRIRYFGYPRLERYFKPAVNPSPQTDAILHKIQQHPKGKSIFFITGFCFADYTEKNLYDSKDLNAEKKCDELLATVESVRRFREEWIAGIIDAAKKNPHLSFIVKKHPTENRETYELHFANFKNITFIHEDIDISDIFPYVGLFLHYGSTTLADTYFNHLPSVYLYSSEKRCRDWYPDMGFPSTVRAGLTEIPRVIGDYQAGKIVFSETPEMRKALKETFNITPGEPYTPSADIAKFLLEDKPKQPVQFSDWYFWKALQLFVYRFLRHKAVKPFKLLLGFDPHYPFKNIPRALLARRHS